jgi:O-antigen ligase
MLPMLFLGALPWLLIFFHQISRRNFVVLLGWLLIAPVVGNLVDRTGNTVVFETQERADARDHYQTNASITLPELIKPTRIMIGLLFIGFLFNTLLKKAPHLRLDRTEIWMCSFSAILLINVLLQSWRLGFGLHVAVDAFIIPFLTYYLARRLVTTEHRFQQLTRVIGYMGIYVIVYCIVERLGTSELMYRLGGPFGNRDVLHVVMVVVFFTTLLQAVSTWSVRNAKPVFSRSIRWFLLLMTPIAIALTIQRGCWLGFLAGLFVFLFCGRRFISLPPQLRMVGFVLILVPAIAFALITAVPQEFFEQRVGDEANVLARFATWIATMQLISEGPVFGVGLNNLHSLLDRREVEYGNIVNLSSPHNSYLSMLVELGVIGLLAYLGVVASIMKRGVSLYRNRNPQDAWRGITVLAIMVGYQIPSLFANTMYSPGLLHVYVYAFIGAIAGLYSSRRQSVSRAHAVVSAHSRRVSKQVTETSGAMLEFPF